MTRNQLNNLVRFSLNFHEDMDIKILSTSPGYILEKWNRYIGVKPYTLETDAFYSGCFDDLHFYYKWSETWNNKDTDIKNIIFIIRNVNEYMFYNDFTITDLVNIYKSYMDVSKVNDYEEKGLHPLVEEIAEKWINSKHNRREYNLFSLNI